MASQHVLLTGAFGHIGQGTLQKLLAKGYRITCLDRKTALTAEVANNFGDKVSVVWGDICDPESVKAALVGVDTVIHLVGLIPPNSEKDPELTHKINCGGTETVVTAMADSGTAKRLIFASTIGVFGKVQDREPPLTSEAPVSPDDHYGRSKVAAEEIIKSSGLDWTILRICASPPLEIEKGAAHGPEVIFEWSPDARIEFVHGDDVSTAFANTVDCVGAIGKVLALGGGSTCQTNVMKFVTSMLNANGIRGGLPKEAFRPSKIPEFYGDWVETVESQRLLNYQNHSFDDFIQHIRDGAGIKRHLIGLISSLAKKSLLKHSPYLSKK